LIDTREGKDIKLNCRTPMVPKMFSANAFVGILARSI
jgi:hypothetical protein